MLAKRYTDDEQRGNAMSIAMVGIALGILSKRFSVFGICLFNYFY